MGFVCGIDTGGTFTDCVVFADGDIVHAKVPSTHHDFTIGVFNGLERAGSQFGMTLEEFLRETDFVFHGTTIATNIMVQKSGARAGLLTTKGFRDLIYIQRGIGRVAGLSPEQVTRISVTSKPDPLVPKDRIGEVVERVDSQGDVVVPLDEESCRAAVIDLLNKGVEAIAICFLWSFRNPSHEVAAERIVRELAPHVFVTRSSSLCPKWGEYERTAAVAINAYVGPETKRYIERVGSRAAELGLKHPMLVMQASGGVASARDIGSNALGTIGSGPTGGVIGSQALAEKLAYSNVIVTDMGGTSFEVGLIADGVPPQSTTSVISQYEYFNPSIAVHSIGAGGGSIAYIDPMGRLRVGPQSAGAEPGPACYGRGGIEPTVTDADVVLGLLNPDYFLDGTMQLDYDAAVQAIDSVAQPLGMSVHEAAAGIVKIAEFAMADLIRKHTVQQGLDPRNFVLFAYGGAGPVHASVFGAELGVREILIPAGDLSSLWSALGVASADVLHVLEQTELMSEPFDPGKLNSAFEHLETQARELLGREGVPLADIQFRRSVDMRYKAQVHVVPVSVPNGDLDGNAIRNLVLRFHDRYESIYGRGAGLAKAGLELLTVRIHAVGLIHRSFLTEQNGSGSEQIPEWYGERDVRWSDLGQLPTPVYRGQTLRNGHRIDGPAIVELPDTTVVVRPGQVLRVDGYGNFHLTSSPAV